MRKKKAAPELHTPEPWAAGSLSGHYVWSDLCTPDEKRYGVKADAKGIVHYTSLYDEGHDIYSVPTLESVAGNYDYEEGGIISPYDVQRIIACVNACKGIPTDVLAAGELGWLASLITETPKADR